MDTVLLNQAMALKAKIEQHNVQAAASEQRYEEWKQRLEAMDLTPETLPKKIRELETALGQEVQLLEEQMSLAQEKLK